MDLVHAALRCGVQFCPNPKYFHVQGNRKQKLTGAHAAVASFLSHSIDVHVANNKGSRGRYESDTTSSCSVIITGLEKNKHGCVGGDANHHGTVVDTELSQFARMPFNQRARFLTVNSEKLDACTMAVIRKLEELGLEAIASQLIVGDVDAGLATAVDLVCRRKRDGACVMVEIKASRHTDTEYYTYSMGMLRAPLNTVPYSMLNVDMLQLLLTKLMIRNGHSRYEVKECLLIRACSGVAHTYEPPEWFSHVRLQELMYEHLRAQWVAKQAAKKPPPPAGAVKKKRERYAAGKSGGPRQKKGRVAYFTPGQDL